MLSPSYCFFFSFKLAAGGCGLSCAAPSYELSTVSCGLSFATNSNVSPTYAPFSRKSNHSHTYAKTWGWGGTLPHDAFSPNSFVFFPYVNFMDNYMYNYIVGAPTFSFSHLLVAEKEEPKRHRRSGDRRSRD